MEGLQDLFRCDREAIKSHSNGIINGIDDGGRRGQLSSLTRFFGAEDTFWIVRLDLYRIDRWDFHGGWNAVI